MTRKVWKPCSASRRLSSTTIAVCRRSSGQTTTAVGAPPAGAVELRRLQQRCGRWPAGRSGTAASRPAPPSTPSPRSASGSAVAGLPSQPCGCCSEPRPSAPSRPLIAPSGSEDVLPGEEDRDAARHVRQEVDGAQHGLQPLDRVEQHRQREATPATVSSGTAIITHRVLSAACAHGRAVDRAAATAGRRSSRGRPRSSRGVKPFQAAKESAKPYRSCTGPSPRRDTARARRTRTRPGLVPALPRNGGHRGRRCPCGAPRRPRPPGEPAVTAARTSRSR